MIRDWVVIAIKKFALHKFIVIVCSPTGLPALVMRGVMAENIEINNLLTPSPSVP